MTQGKKTASFLPLLCAVLLSGGMVLAADVLQNREIIFPEAALPVFPLQIFCGISVLVAASYLYRESDRKQHCSRYPAVQSGNRNYP